jgi:hypothetical protein
VAQAFEVVEESHCLQGPERRRLGSRSTSRQSALVAAAEFLVAKAEGFVGDDHIKAEIGEVLAGTAPGRTSVSAITIYKSLGHIVQDLAALTYLDARTISDSAFDAGNTTKRN